jgi:hypothetical protein
MLALLPLSAPAAAAATATWTGPTLVDDSAVIETSGLSCVADGPSMTCVAVDSQGRALVFDPVTHTTATAQLPGGDLWRDVACVSTTRCVAVSDDSIVRFSPAAPKLGTRILSSGWDAVDCRGTLCVLVGGRQVGTLDPTGSAAPVVVPDAVPSDVVLVAVSCPAATMCEAGDLARQVVRFDPAAPSGLTPTTLAGVGDLKDLSCVTTTHCTAVGDFGSIGYNPDGSGLKVTRTFAVGPLVGVTCVVVGECVATSNDGTQVTYDPDGSLAAVKASTGEPFAFAPWRSTARSPGSTRAPSRRT